MPFFDVTVEKHVKDTIVVEADSSDEAEAVVYENEHFPHDECSTCGAAEWDVTGVRERS